jgi:hypothetical protein
MNGAWLGVAVMTKLVASPPPYARLGYRATANSMPVSARTRHLGDACRAQVARRVVLLGKQMGLVHKPRRTGTRTLFAVPTHELSCPIGRENCLQGDPKIKKTKTCIQDPYYRTN